MLSVPASGKVVRPGSQRQLVVLPLGVFHGVALMSKARRVPSYGLHKATGQARVIINGKHIYLGKFGSPSSHAEYHRLVAESFASGTPCTGPTILS
jgi:hypothetical protein